MEYLDKLGLSTLWNKVKSYINEKNFIPSSEKGKANGLASLDENGKIPLSQLGNLDMSLFKVVESLPTSDILSNRIYLIRASSTSSKNVYAEYLYTGDTSKTYDETKWEKLGEYKSDVDITSYAKTETVNAALLEKVDKVEGKGLSENDYTTAEKNKLANLQNYTLPTATKTTLGGVKAITNIVNVDTETATVASLAGVINTLLTQLRTAGIIQM